jgi:hypothetical protein
MVNDMSNKPAAGIPNVHGVPFPFLDNDQQSDRCRSGAVKIVNWTRSELTFVAACGQLPHTRSIPERPARLRGGVFPEHQFASIKQQYQ